MQLFSEEVEDRKELKQKLENNMPLIKTTKLFFKEEEKLVETKD